MNPINKKRIKLITRETLLHYMGDPYPISRKIETPDEMRAECALLGKGWQTLEIEHFYEWQYINYAVYSKIFINQAIGNFNPYLVLRQNYGTDACGNSHVYHPMPLDGL